MSTQKSPAKRGRKRTTATLNKKIVAKAITAVSKRRMGAVSFARENNLNPVELLSRLKQEGIEVRRGRPRLTPVSAPVQISA
jgi:hypothetical protein